MRQLPSGHITRRAGLAWAAAALAWPAHAQGVAVPPELRGDWPQARLQGQTRLTFFGLHIYDARLWAPAAVAAADTARAALAIELIYARGLSGTKIAERSLDEMRRVGSVDDAQAARWLQAMKRLFPDVKAGDRITGLQQPGQGARFFVNGQLAGEVREDAFAMLFFGIWLSPKTSEPTLREQLLGLRP
ncbi:chalcone isomerase family protein [Ideonella margarita]|uniref:Chalcone isomerase family protein n=1 Tax=Ideonella margarita TaxID=2984191 RepID=A0ABU9C8L8_9BURK